MVELTNVQLRYFPPNSAFVGPLLGKNIVNSVECTYKHREVHKFLLNLVLKRETKVYVFMAFELAASRWRGARQSIIVNFFRNADFETPNAEIALNFASPQRWHEEDVPTTWECLCQLDLMAAGLSLSDYANTGADAVTTEELSDDDILQLITSVEKKAEEDANDAEVAEDSVSILHQVMHALDLLMGFAGAHEGTEDILNALVSYEKFVQPLLTKCVQARITNFFPSKKICCLPGHFFVSNVVLYASVSLHTCFRGP